MTVVDGSCDSVRKLCARGQLQIISIDIDAGIGAAVCPCSIPSVCRDTITIISGAISEESGQSCLPFTAANVSFRHAPAPGSDALQATAPDKLF